MSGYNFLFVMQHTPWECLISYHSNQVNLPLREIISKDTIST